MCVNVVGLEVLDWIFFGSELSPVAHFFLYSWDRASLDIEVVYMTNKMRQIHSIYF
jgi:hypothetical protein